MSQVPRVALVAILLVLMVGYCGVALNAATNNLFNGVSGQQSAAGYWQFVGVEYHEVPFGPTSCSPDRKEGGEGNVTVTRSTNCYGADNTPLSVYKVVWTAPAQILVPNAVLDFKATVTLVQNRNPNNTLGIVLKGKFLPYNAPFGQASYFDTPLVGPQRREQSAGTVYSLDNLARPAPLKVPGTGVADSQGRMQFMVELGSSSSYWWNYVYKWTEPRPGAPVPGAGQPKSETAQDSATALVNLALGKPAVQSSTGYGGTADRAVDGNTNGNYFAGRSVTHTEESNQPQPWWQVDLGVTSQIDHVILWNRRDCCGERLASVWVFVSDSPFPAGDVSAFLRDRRIWRYGLNGTAGPQTRIAVGRRGRYIRIQLSGRAPLSLAEVQVFGK